jgi:hypothetical protein
MERKEEASQLVALVNSLTRSKLSTRTGATALITRNRSTISQLRDDGTNAASRRHARRQPLPLVMMLGLFGSNQVAAIGSIAVVLGGIVSLGSNVSTLRQTMAAMSAAEALRSDLISRIDLRVVSDRTMKRI